MIDDIDVMRDILERHERLGEPFEEAVRQLWLAHKYEGYEPDDIVAYLRKAERKTKIKLERAMKSADFRAWISGLYLA